MLTTGDRAANRARFQAEANRAMCLTRFPLAITQLGERLPRFLDGSVVAVGTVHLPSGCRQPSPNGLYGLYGFADTRPQATLGGLLLPAL